MRRRSWGASGAPGGGGVQRASKARPVSPDGGDGRDPNGRTCLSGSSDQTARLAAWPEAVVLEGAWRAAGGRPARQALRAAQGVSGAPSVCALLDQTGTPSLWYGLAPQIGGKPAGRPVISLRASSWAGAEAALGPSPRLAGPPSIYPTYRAAMGCPRRPGFRSVAERVPAYAAISRRPSISSSSAMITQFRASQTLSGLHCWRPQQRRPRPGRRPSLRSHLGASDIDWVGTTTGGRNAAVTRRPALILTVGHLGGCCVRPSRPATIGRVLPQAGD